MKSRIHALHALLAMAAVSGCVAPKRTKPEVAVFCPKCEMIWIETADLDDPYRLSNFSTEVMSCPDCESAVVHFFKTGKLEHACKTCGSELVHCTSHDN